MNKTRLEELSKEELIEVIAKLDKKLSRRKCGIVWDYEKVPEDVVLNGDKNVAVLKKSIYKDIVLDKSDDNVLIVGENYLSLECLSYTHNQMFDVIYIDPPYNTLKEGFMYNDVMVDQEDRYRHSKWLNFMEKRLKLASKLLSQNGYICISIDDNEFAQLKLLCDQIFKEENLLDIFHIKVRYDNKSLNDKDHFHKLMEYVLVYAKNKKTFIPNKPCEDYSIDKFIYEIKLKGKPKIETIGNKKVEIYNKDDYEVIKHNKGSIDYLKSTWASGSVTKGNASGAYFEKYLKPRKDVDGTNVLYKVYGIGEEGDGIGYRFFTGPKKQTATQGLFYSGVPLNRLEDIKKGNSSVKYIPIINYYDYAADFGNIKDEGGINFPSGKKPIVMLKQLINMHPNKNALVLDFFAGSGSTGHAVLSLNNDDGGNRKFILCTNNEVKNELIKEFCHNNNISKDDYSKLLHQKEKRVTSFVNKNGLATLFTYPRLSNVIKGWKTTKGSIRDGYKSNLKVYESDVISIDGINNITDSDRRKLTKVVGDMIALKENTFVEIEKNDWFQVFENRKKTKLTAIYFQENLEQFDNLIATIGKKICSLYIYSSGKLIPETFSYLPSNIIVKDIPQPILNVYTQIYKSIRR